MPIPTIVPIIASLAASSLYNAHSQNQQFNRNIELWNMQNEYNSPINQMARLKQAGLNPLYYGLDGNSSGAPAEAPTAPVKNPFEAMLIAKQVQEMDSNIAAQKATASKTNAEAKAQDLTNQYLEQKLKDEETSRKYQLEYDAHQNVWLFHTPTNENQDTFSDKDTYGFEMFKSKFAEARANRAKSEHDTEYYEKKKPFVMRLLRNEINSSDYDTETKKWASKQAEEIYNNYITQGEQMSLDLNVDKENKDLTQKLGILGKIIELIDKIFN